MELGPGQETHHCRLSDHPSWDRQLGPVAAASGFTDDTTPTTGTLQVHFQADQASAIARAVGSATDRYVKHKPPSCNSFPRFLHRRIND